MLNVFVKNYGCQMNVYDTNKLLDLLSGINFQETKRVQHADLIILNTCHIREKAVAKLYSDLGRINIIKKSSQNEILIAVIGCVAQIQGVNLKKKFKHIDFVLGTQAIQKLPELIKEYRGANKFDNTPNSNDNKHFVNTTFATDEKFLKLNINKNTNQKVSAFVTIQEGCDNFCTYCSVPNARGREYSRNFQHIIDEVQYLRDLNVKEIILLGQNVNSYNFNKNNTTYYLEDLFYSINKIDGIERIRFISPNPQNMRDDLILSYKDVKKLMPFLHLPLQSGSDRILKLMNRPYTSDEYLEIVEKFKQNRPDMLFSTDIIVGFPDESDSDFEQTISIINKMKYSNGFYFKYSPRPHTIAASMKNQIEESVKNERFQILHKLMMKFKEQSNSNFIGKIVNVLFEEHVPNTDSLTGKSEYYQNVLVTNGHNTKTGEIKKVLITSSTMTNLIGDIFE